MTGLLLFGSFAILLMLSVPVAFSLGAATMLTIVISPDINVSVSVVAQRLFGGLGSTSIMAIPFFVLAGNLMTKGGISKRLVNFANSIVGRVRGGMSLTLVLSAALFAALSGSAPATVIAIGSMLYSDMVRIGYPPEKTAGLLVVSGGLGPIIPPSIIMVVIGTLTGVSIGDLFKSGMFIGIIMVIVLMIVVFIIAQKEKWPKVEAKVNFKDLFMSFILAIPALMLPVIILGGIYSGIMTPTESSAAAVVWALFAGLFIYRELKLNDLIEIFIESGKSSAMILFIIATSTAFSWLFSYSGLSNQIVNGIVGLNLNATVLILIIALIFLVFGIFLEGIATAVLMVPVLWPVAQSLGINGVHFGVVVSIAIVIGTMTPPVAVNIFSAASVTKLKMGQIVHGQKPFFLAFIFVFFLVVLFPIFSTFFID